jgi:hypothetical protein
MERAGAFQRQGWEISMSSNDELFAAEFDKGAAAARALLALIGAAGSATMAAPWPEAPLPDASDDYQRGAAEARRLLGIRATPAGLGAPASSLRSAAELDDGECEKGAAEARRLLGIAAA